MIRTLRMLLLAGALSVALGGCTLTYRGGELHHVEADIPFESTFEDVRGMKSKRVLHCEAGDVERFVSDLLTRSAESKVAPPPSARGAVLLAIRRDDTTTGGVFDSWVSDDGTAGEVGMVYRRRHGDDGHVGLIGTWTHWTASRVEHWNKMIANARPMDD
jgi:hypothetical protein